MEELRRTDTTLWGRRVTRKQNNFSHLHSHWQLLWKRNRTQRFHPSSFEWRTSRCCGFEQWAAPVSTQGSAASSALIGGEDKGYGWRQAAIASSHWSQIRCRLGLNCPTWGCGGMVEKQGKRHWSGGWRIPALLINWRTPCWGPPLGLDERWDWGEAKVMCNSSSVQEVQALERRWDVNSEAGSIQRRVGCESLFFCCRWGASPRLPPLPNEIMFTPLQLLGKWHRGGASACSDSSFIQQYEQQALWIRMPPSAEVFVVK